MSRVLDVNGAPVVLPRSPWAACAIETQTIVDRAEDIGYGRGVFQVDTPGPRGRFAGLAFRAAELVYDAEQRAAMWERAWVALAFPTRAP